MLDDPFNLTETPWSVYKGSYFEKIFQWKTDGVGVDITGYAFQSMVREKYKSEDPIITTGTVEGGISIVDASIGKIKMFFTLANSDLFNVPLGFAGADAITLASQIPYKDFPFDVDAIPPDTTKRFQLIKGVYRVYGENTR